MKYTTLPTLLSTTKEGFSVAKNMFRTLFRAGLMSLIIPRVGWSVEHSDKWKWSPLEKSLRNAVLESSWNVMAHCDARKGKWRGNWRMEWVASTLTLLPNMVYPALLPLMRTLRLPVDDWTDARADSNGLVSFAERRNLVSARVSSQFKRSLPSLIFNLEKRCTRFLRNVGTRLQWIAARKATNGTSTRHLSHVSSVLTVEALHSLIAGYLRSKLHFQHDITQPFVLTVRSSSPSQHVRISDEASAILSTVYAVSLSHSTRTMRF